MRAVWISISTGADLASLSFAPAGRDWLHLFALLPFPRPFLFTTTARSLVLIVETRLADRSRLAQVRFDLVL